MKTLSIEVTKDMAAPPAEVWSVLADYARDGEWREGVHMTQDPPGRAVAGATTYERLRFMGSEKKVVATIEAVDPGRRLAFRTVESDIPVRGERRVEPREDGTTRVTFVLEMWPSGVWALLAGPVGFLFRRRVERDLDRLAALVTSSAAVARAA